MKVRSYSKSKIIVSILLILLVAANIFQLFRYNNMNAKFDSLKNEHSKSILFSLAQLYEDTKPEVFFDNQAKNQSNVLTLQTLLMSATGYWDDYSTNFYHGYADKAVSELNLLLSQYSALISSVQSVGKTDGAETCLTILNEHLAILIEENADNSQKSTTQRLSDQLIEYNKAIKSLWDKYGDISGISIDPNTGVYHNAKP